MPTQICNDAHGYGCCNFVDYTSDEERQRVFRKVKRHEKGVVKYCFRKTCLECEARNMRERLAKKRKNNKGYDWWDYGVLYAKL